MTRSVVYGVGLVLTVACEYIEGDGVGGGAGEGDGLMPR